MQGSGSRRAIIYTSLLLFFSAASHVSPQAPPPELSSADLDAILQALRGAGLTTSATILQAAIATGTITLPAGDFTIFVPTNTAIDAILPSDTDLSAALPYHIANQALPYAALVSLPLGTPIPTLLPGSTLLVTNDDPENFLIDQQLVLSADLCPTVASVACHAINGVLNSTAWGRASIAFPPAAPPAGVPIFPPLGAPLLPPVGAPFVPFVPPVGAPLLPPVGGPPPAGAPGVPGGFGPPPGVPGVPALSPGGGTPGGDDNSGAGEGSGCVSQVYVIAAVVVWVFTVLGSCNLEVERVLIF